MTAAPIVTRFAPSPTGELHLGNVRTALFNALLARRGGGRFILRIEDTDRERSRSGFTSQLCAELRWLGLPWDEGPDVGGPAGPYEQSARAGLHAEQLARLAAAGRLYPCFCSALELDVSRRTQLAAGHPPRYAGTCRDLSLAERAERSGHGRSSTLRFRVPAGARIEFDDLVHGRQAFLSDDIGDFVVQRSDGSAAFFFSNAVDDAAMGVTHVLRGEDHLTNTPRQLLLFAALGVPPPVYGHLALLVGSDGAPLSKRSGAASLRQLREAGYLPEALRNWLFRLGHTTPEHGLLGPEAMARAFDTAHLGRAPARCDPAQLDFWQRDAVRALSDDAAFAWLQPALPAALPPERARALALAVRANCVLPRDAAYWARVIDDTPPELDAAAVAAVQAAGPAFFKAAVAAAAAPDWPQLVASVKAVTGLRGPQLFKPLRIALTGCDHGPELAPLLQLMSRDSVVARFARFAD